MLRLSDPSPCCEDIGNGDAPISFRSKLAVDKRAAPTVIGSSRKVPRFNQGQRVVGNSVPIKRIASADAARRGRDARCLHYSALWRWLSKRAMSIRPHSGREAQCAAGEAVAAAVAAAASQLTAF